MLRRWIKKNNQRIGLVVADVVNGQIAVGYSLWNRLLDTRPNWDTAINVAKERMKRDAKYPYSRSEIPPKALGEFASMAVRANKFFQGEKPRDISDFLTSSVDAQTGVIRYYGFVAPRSKEDTDLKVHIAKLGDTLFSYNPDRFYASDYVRVRIKKVDGVEHTRVDKV